MEKQLEKQIEENWPRIVARAWLDEEFRAELMASPQAVLKKMNIDLPKGMDVRVTEGEARPVLALPLPPRPPGIDSGAIQSLASAEAACPGAFCCC